ncbi:MAG: hypothetical protein ABIK28_09845, partial [Planctomycetota bacterium]
FQATTILTRTVQNYLLLNQGEDLHVVGASMGAGILRDNIFPSIEDLGLTLDLKSLMMVEAMAPSKGMNNYWASDAIDFDLYVSYETSYIGPFGETFKKLSGAGPLVPEDWQNRNCYFFPSYLGHLYMKYPWDFTKAIAAHGGGVGNGEDYALKLLEMYLAALSSGDPQAVQAMLDKLDGWKQNDPTIPFPGSDPDPDPGDDDPVTGGGSGPSGGGSGVESFPHWLSLEDYRRYKPKLFGKRKGTSPIEDSKGKPSGKRPITTEIPITTEVLETTEEEEE